MLKEYKHKGMFTCNSDKQLVAICLSASGSQNDTEMETLDRRQESGLGNHKRKRKVIDNKLKGRSGARMQTHSVVSYANVRTTTSDYQSWLLFWLAYIHSIMCQQHLEYQKGKDRTDRHCFSNQNEE